MDENKRLCTACKLILPSEFAYCPMCGQPVIDQVSPSQALPYEPPPDENPILLERLSGALGGRRGIIIALVVLVLIVFGAIAVIALTQSPTQPIVIPSETPTPTPTPSPTITPTPTPSPTFFPTPTPSPTFFPTPTPSPTFFPTPTPSPTPITSRIF